MLNEKNVVIIGGSRGIGESIAKLFAKNRANITLMSRSKKDLKRVTDEIVLLGGKANWIFMDISDVKSVTTAFEKFRLFNKKINILINNSGIYRENSETYDDNKINLEAIYNLINTNMLGYWWSTIIAQDLIIDSGSIVNISSVNGILGKSKSDIYDMTKAAINNMTLNHARKLSLRKIRVNAICPSSTITPMRDDAMNRYLKNKSREEFDNYEADTIPFKRLCDPQEIAEVALFLASDKSQYITGQIISVDGGFLLKPVF